MQGNAGPVGLPGEIGATGAKVGNYMWTLLLAHAYDNNYNPFKRLMCPSPIRIVPGIGQKSYLYTAGPQTFSKADRNPFEHS